MAWNRNTKWSVHIIFQAQFRASVHFNAPLTVGDLMAIRKLSANHANLPIAKLKESIGRSSQIDLGLMSHFEAHELRRKADKHGVNFKIENMSFIRHVPVDESNGQAWIIEDNVEAERIAKEMIAAGAKVQHIHAD